MLNDAIQDDDIIGHVTLPCGVSCVRRSWSHGIRSATALATTTIPAANIASEFTILFVAAGLAKRHDDNAVVLHSDRKHF